jgi:D-lyxose ketol-isomerase
VIYGELTVKTEWGKVKLKRHESFTVHPPDMHEFSTGEKPTGIIEIAYVRLKPDDINRENIGGPIVPEMTTWAETVRYATPPDEVA